MLATKNRNLTLKTDERVKVKKKKKVIVLQWPRCACIDFHQRGRCSSRSRDSLTSLGEVKGQRLKKTKTKHTLQCFQGEETKRENFIVCFSQTGCRDSNFLSAVAQPPQLFISFSSDIWFPSVGSGRISDIYRKKKHKKRTKQNEIALLCLCAFFFVIAPVCWFVCRLFHLNNFFFLWKRRRYSLARSLLVRSPALSPATFLILLNLSVWLFFPPQWHRLPLEIK